MASLILNVSLVNSSRIAGRPARHVVSDRKTHSIVSQQTLPLFRCKKLVNVVNNFDVLIIFIYLETDIPRPITRSVGCLHRVA